MTRLVSSLQGDDSVVVLETGLGLVTGPQTIFKWYWPLFGLGPDGVEVSRTSCS